MNYLILDADITLVSKGFSKNLIQYIISLISYNTKIVFNQK